MAIGLDQTKRKPKPRVPKKPVETKAGTASEALAPALAITEARRPQLKPWSQKGLAKKGYSSKDPSTGDYHLNDEWMDLTSAKETPLFWIDFTRDSRLSLFQDKLAEVEERAIELIKKPKKIFSSFKKSLGLK